MKAAKVLIINDCKFEREVFTKLLQSKGAEVEATDEFNAISRIKAFEPDIAIVNLIMKETTGDDLIAEIKNKFPHIKCVLSSSNPLSLSKYRSKQVDAVLETPIEKEKLEPILK